MFGKKKKTINPVLAGAVGVVAVAGAAATAVVLSKQVKVGHKGMELKVNGRKKVLAPKQLKRKTS